MTEVGVKTWVVVASAARARFFEVTGRLAPWRELLDLVNSDDRLRRQEFVSDKPGRTVDSARGQHHTLDPSADPKERAAEQFARQVVEKLEAGLYDKQFESLTVVAPPHFLGLLREQMGEALVRAVRDEVTKDLTREDAAGLQAHLAELK